MILKPRLSFIVMIPFFSAGAIEDCKRSSDYPWYSLVLQPCRRVVRSAVEALIRCLHWSYNDTPYSVVSGGVMLRLASQGVKDRGSMANNDNIAACQLSCTCQVQYFDLCNTCIVVLKWPLSREISTPDITRVWARAARRPASTKLTCSYTRHSRSWNPKCNS